MAGAGGAGAGLSVRGSETGTEAEPISVRSELLPRAAQACCNLLFTALGACGGDRDQQRPETVGLERLGPELPVRFYLPGRVLLLFPDLKWVFIAQCARLLSPPANSPCVLTAQLLPATAPRRSAPNLGSTGCQEPSGKLLVT